MNEMRCLVRLALSKNQKSVRSLPLSLIGITTLEVAIWKSASLGLLTRGGTQELHLANSQRRVFPFPLSEGIYTLDRDETRLVDHLRAECDLAKPKRSVMHILIGGMKRVLSPSRAVRCGRDRCCGRSCYLLDKLSRDRPLRRTGLATCFQHVCCIGCTFHTVSWCDRQTLTKRGPQLSVALKLLLSIGEYLSNLR